MNLVLADSEEFRATKKSLAKGAAAAASISQKDAQSTSATTTTIKEEKRAIGLIILRGETIVSVSVEAPPATDHRSGGPLGPQSQSQSLSLSQSQNIQSQSQNQNSQGSVRPITRAPLSGPVRTNAGPSHQPPAFFGAGSGGGGGGGPGNGPPGFHPPPGFGGSR